MKKTTLIATALTATLVTSSAFAWWGDDDRGQKGRGYEGCGYSQQGHGMKGKHGRRGGGAQMKQFMERTLTADEIKTVQEAKLIYQNNPNITVGEVKSTDDGYSVTIVTKKEQSLVETLELAKNGMPLDRYNMMKERMQQRLNKQTPPPAPAAQQ